MKDIFNKAKEFIGLGQEEEGEMQSSAGTKPEVVSVESSPFRIRSGKRSNGSDFDIAIYEPKAYENSVEISARLRQGNPVIVNLKYLDQTEGTRLIDFVCGTAFAIDGHMMKIADTIFLLTPSNVDISDLSEVQQHDGSVVREGLLHNRL